jgi:glycosyltransferase involved in cell wall biosynthesis
MLSNNITVCIFAWNEEARILRCIDNFKGLFPILVVDNCSTDQTVKTATDAGYKTVTVKNPGFIETTEVMDPVMAACDTDYILVSSVSEFIPLALLLKYAEAANTGSHDIVRAFRESITAGQPIPISGRPRPGFPGELRFFRKGSVDFSGNKVHDRGTIVVAPERVLSLVTNPEYHFYQFRDYDSSHTELKHRTYNDVLAKQRYDAGARFSWARLILHSSKQFLDAYVRFGSWRFGMLGFMHSFYRWHMEVGIWLRIWEWQHDLSRSGVIQANNAVRVRLEQQIIEFMNARAKA